MQFGPMGKEQLGEFLIWKPKTVPDNFAFLLNRYERHRECDYQASELKVFLNDAMTWQVENARTLFVHLKGKEV